MVKRLTIILLIILGVFISFSLYRTYAYNTTVVEDTPTTTDLEYTFKIGNSSIKEITISSGETKYYDVVLGNPNNAKISYSIYYEMVSPNAKPDGFSIEYTSKSTGESTGKVDKNGNITLNLVVTNTSSSVVTVKLGSIAGYVNGGELVLSSGQEVIPKLTASKFIMSLDDGSTGDSGSGVYKIEHDAIPAENSATGSEIPAVTDYRYYGASPNNYICLDNSGGTCEDRHLYRIIGSIYEENSGQNLLKIIKATELKRKNNSTWFNWDCRNLQLSGISARGNAVARFMAGEINNCDVASNTFGGSSLEKNLENWYDGVGMFENLSIKNEVKTFLNSNNIYYLGGIDDNTIKINDLYLKERGTMTSGDNGLTWYGTFGLPYLSDYGYAAGSKCVNSSSIINNDDCISWISNVSFPIWTLTPRLEDDFKVYVFSSNNMNSLNVISSGLIFPTFYLSKDVVITSGTGSLEDPYLVTK